MKIIFAGTPTFALTALIALLESKYNICAVYTKPDRPVGRGRKIECSPVKQFAIEQSIPVFQPKTLKSPETQSELANLKPDLMIVAAYGLILPKATLDIPKHGCINIHASLLPRWRGASPIQHAILSGDKETGITIMQMDEGLDTGNMLHKITCPISNKDNAAQLHDRLAEMGGKAMIETLQKMELGTLKPIPQNDKEATYAHKINKEDGCIDWSESAKKIDQKIKAFNPWPIAYTEINQKTIRIWEAETLCENTNKEKPGTIAQVQKEGIDVITSDQILRLKMLQLPGKKPLQARDILNAYSDLFKPGNCFTSS